MNIVKKRNWFFTFSILIIVLGVFSVVNFGLKLGIDFTGGTLWEIQFNETDNQLVKREDIRKIFTDNDSSTSSIAETSQNSILIRTEETREENINNIKQNINSSFGQTEDLRLETVGPTISKELTKKALIAVSISIIAILLYVTWAFRKVPKPASSIAFGVCTIIALFHDVIITVGSFAILGYFLNFEINSLFITALLTVLGFSVHDTIVVFDRIRENISKHKDYPFETIVNHSLIQTISRSLNTSITVVFVLLALLLFGGDSIKGFTTALLIGIVSGTYSSIFIAAPLLVVWKKLKIN
jgi:preprotein translocase subunit SecF